VDFSPTFFVRLRARSCVHTLLHNLSFHIFVNHRFLVLLAATAVFPAVAQAQPVPFAASAYDEPIKLNKVVVSAGPGARPLETTLDVRAPVQPIPAQDGADLLKSVPGFSVIRKGGADGDPVLRGQAGSRLNVLLDGENILGGCGNRMDPPTAYVFPAAYDRVTILKGPQTVLYGPGGSAGVVRFERDDKRLTELNVKLNGSLTLGSYGREDEAVEILAGVPTGLVRVTGTHSQQDDYKDGSGRQVHSSYCRWSANVATGWTPDEQTSVVLSAARSDGEAAYADRMMDGVVFDRENLGLSFKRAALTGVVAKIEGRVFYNYVDHVMDNYSLRPFVPTMMMPGRAVSNPDRKTIGGRAAIELKLAARTNVTVGFDGQQNRHTVRSSSNQTTDPFESHARVQDAEFTDYGVFGEVTQTLAERLRLVAGLRADQWKVTDERASIKVGMGSMANPTKDQSRCSLLVGGFARLEKDFAALPLTAYLGLGYTERFPDYWELFSKESADSLSAFATKPETTTQIDAGVIYKKEALTGSLSIFANRVSDYILIQSGYSKPSSMMGTRTTTISRNVDASAWGGEVTLAYRFAGYWKLDGSLAYMQGRNRTDGLPLAQQPPLEMRLGLGYATDAWSVGGLTRIVARQNRYALGQGNIVGQDLGPTGGFTVFSLNGGWRIAAYAQITAGVDNLFDKTYAEFISRGGSDVPGYTTTNRVNEPGRMLWAKLDLKY
jgi:iron complex outermembrane recepter protein